MITVYCLYVYTMRRSKQNKTNRFVVLYANEEGIEKQSQYLLKQKQTFSQKCTYNDSIVLHTFVFFFGIYFSMFSDKYFS